MKKQTSATSSPFFKPERAGEYVEGKFGGFERGTVEGKTVDSMKVGDRKVSISVVIWSFLSKDNLANSLRKGKDTVKVQFTGKKGRAKLYRMFVNGKEVFQNFQGEEVKGAQVLKNRPKTRKESLA